MTTPPRSASSTELVASREYVLWTRETLTEAGRCTRVRITINTFMLERSRALAAFVERMTRLNRGRAFFADPDDLGSTVLVDYVGRRSGRA